MASKRMEQLQNLEEKTTAKTEVSMAQGTTNERNAVALDEMKPSASESGTKRKSECESTEEEHVDERGAKKRKIESGSSVHGSAEVKKELGDEVYKYPFQAKWDAMNDLLNERDEKRRAENSFEATIERAVEMADAMNASEEEKERMIQSSLRERRLRLTAAQRKDVDEMETQYYKEARKAMKDVRDYTRKRRAEHLRRMEKVTEDFAEMSKQAEEILRDRKKLMEERTILLAKLGFRRA